VGETEGGGEGREVEGGREAGEEKAAAASAAGCGMGSGALEV